MQPVKLTIYGSYWDSQIYSGEFILFDLDAKVRRIDWRSLVDEYADYNKDIQTAIRVAFSDSDLFYNPKVKKILSDPQIEFPIKHQLNSLSSRSIDLGNIDLNKHCRLDSSPFDFLPTDTEVYYSTIFAAGDEGLYSVPKHKNLETTESIKHHDARILQVKASDKVTAVAAAAGDDGLFEFAFRKDEYDVLDDARTLAKRPCSACDWSFQSIMGWSSNNSFLVNFRDEINPQDKNKSRTFDRIVETSEIFQDFDKIFGETGLSWGCREKIYRIVNNKVEVSNYEPNIKKRTSKQNESIVKMFDRHGDFSLDFNGNDVIATGTAPFGTVFELEDSLIVFRSDGGIEKFNGSPVHWRVFSRSEHYSNQLHIIYDDRIEIISFVHDYFVNQDTKLSGFKRG